MGGAPLASVPVVVLFAFLMDYYIAGLTGGCLDERLRKDYLGGDCRANAHLYWIIPEF